jgi:glycosyltransferase involved in cell wall biosynthesis
VKVGIYIPHVSPIVGGAHTYESQFLKALSRLDQYGNHSFTCYTHATLQEMPDAPLKSSALTVRCVPHQSLFWRFIYSIMYPAFRLLPPGFFPSCRTHPIDKVASIDQMECMIFFGTYHIPSDLPYIVIAWDIQHRVQPWFPEVSMKGIWDHREARHAALLRRAAFVVIGNEAGAEDIEFFYRIPRSRIRIIPMPTPEFDVDQSSGASQNGEAASKLPERFLFYPANFWAHKNHVNLLLALKRLNADFSLDMHLVLVGHDTGNERYIRDMVRRLGLSDVVHFLGFVSRSTLRLLYEKAFALTFVSFFGPDNLPPLEAFSVGCPVISANWAGAHEQLGDAAMLVDPRQPDKIADAVMALHNTRGLRDALVARGFERARLLTAENSVRAILSMLDEFEPVRRCWPVG